MNPGFRMARETDLPDIVRTYNATIPSRLVTADLEPVSVESKLKWFREHSPESRPLLIVNTGDNYAGWMSFGSFYGRPAYEGTAELSVYLDEKFRGKGIGKACLQKAQELAPSLRIHTLLGFIFAHNKNSLGLFEQMGYQRWALLPGIANIDGHDRDLVIVGKKVAEQAPSGI